jgi:hypothetical protein
MRSPVSTRPARPRIGRLDLAGPGAAAVMLKDFGTSLDAAVARQRTAKFAAAVSD